MFKLFILVIGLAAYGAYALLERATPAPLSSAVAAPSPTPTPDAPLLAHVATHVGNWALISTAEAAGLRVLPASPDICDERSLVSLEALSQFNQLLPPPGQVLLQELQTTADKTPIQRYSGADGVGVCFPALGYATVWPLSGGVPGF